MIINKESLCFEQLFAQKKQSEDVVWALGNENERFSHFSDISWNKRLIVKIIGRLIDKENNR